jgi:hypothetical protein
MDTFASAQVISWLKTFMSDESIIRYFRGKARFVSPHKIFLKNA